jgi:integrase
MPGQLVDALRLHRVVQATERLAAGSMWTDSGVVFTGPTGKPVDHRADHREWQRLLMRAGGSSA